MIKEKLMRSDYGMPLSESNCRNGLKKHPYGEYEKTRKNYLF